LTLLLFREDAYRREATATVGDVRADGIVLDQTLFYATAGGQPCDTGTLELEDGRALSVVDVRKDGDSVLHVLAPDTEPPAAGARVRMRIDWSRRHRHMRTHTCLHLLCRAVDGVVTGGQVGELRGRLDFDIPEPTLDKEALTEQLRAWVGEDHLVRDRWIDDAELDRHPELVRTMSVQPPRGQGRIRLVGIEDLDLQACGGTHVRSTAEIGLVTVAKIEKKGRQNRRVVLTIEG
jgi:misacylated tRNA(Ala) deacylase